MRYRQIIVEEFYPDKAVKNYGKQLVAAYKEESEGQAQWADNFDIMYFAERLIKDIAESDPSENNAYTYWLIRLYINGGIQRFEDIPSKAIPALEDFDILKKKKIPEMEKDINKYQTLGQLLNVVEFYSDYLKRDEKKKSKDIEKELIENEEAKILYNNDEIKVILPETERAACFYGKNTRWCTASTRGTNFFNRYNREGPLFILLIKKKNERYQFHFESGQFMDEEDYEVTIEERMKIGNKWPILKDIFNKRAIHYGWLEFIKDPNGLNREEIERIINHALGYFLYWPNPNDFVKEVSIDMFPGLIEDIENPSVELQMKSVSQSPWLIKHIKNPAKETQLEALNEDFLTFNLIDNDDLVPETVTIAQLVIKNINSEFKRILKILKEKTRMSTDEDDLIEIHRFRNYLINWKSISSQLENKIRDYTRKNGNPSVQTQGGSYNRRSNPEEFAQAITHDLINYHEGKGVTCHLALMFMSEMSKYDL